MSLRRFVYYSAVVGGWAAFLAWMVAEMLLLGDSPPGTVRTVLIAALVGAAIGAGLNLVAGMTNTRWQQQLKRLPAGLIGGGIGGAIGGLLGNVLYSTLGLSRALGWMVMGLAIGGVEGIYEGSRSKLRNGLIGGGLGGLLGGWLFDRVALPEAEMAARATAFVILGVAIGALIGLTQVVLKEAWLTVVDGFRPGRELILSQTVTKLGRGDHLPLPFLGYAGRDLESEHLKIIRGPGGEFSIEDNHSRLGTLVNGKRLQGPAVLNDGDLIKLGSNIIRFNLRQRGSERARVPDSVQTGGVTGEIAPPPPPPGSSPRPAPLPPAAPAAQPSPPEGGPRIPPPPPPPS